VLAVILQDETKEMPVTWSFVVVEVIEDPSKA